LWNSTAFGIRKSKIENRKSKIENRKSEITQPPNIMQTSNRRNFLKVTGGAIAATTAVAASAGGKEHGSERGHGKGCTLATMKGRHGYSYSGTVIGVGPVATAGLIFFDGQGNVAADYVVSVNGEIIRGSFTGVYTVNPDCTGLIRLDLPVLGLSLNGSFVIINDGQETFFTGNDPGYAITGVTKKITL